MSIQEIRVKSTQKDTRGEGVIAEVRRTIGIPNLESVDTARVYRLEGATKQEAEKLAEKLFCEPITEVHSLNKHIIGTSFSNRIKSSLNLPFKFLGLKKPFKSFDAVEVAYKPGVMNPESASIIKAAKDLGIDLKAVDSSTEYGFYGRQNKKEIKQIVNNLLMNKTVERVVSKKPKTLIIEGEVKPTQIISLRGISGEELIALSKKHGLELNVIEMKVMQNYFQDLGRDPTDCEIQIFAARWSEHCGHKTFKAKVIVDGVEKPPLFERITETAKKYFGDEVVSAFKDNSGVVIFYEGYAICFKVETHNSPSAIEPYGGAATGTGGVLRDIMGTGQGARIIVSTDIFCFAPFNMESSKLLQGTLNPDYLLRRTFAGVRDYGNRMGIPTNNGSYHFHEDFQPKPTVIVGAGGILPEARAQKGEPKDGDLLLVVGGKTGKDGIHGATFSSAEMTHKTVEINSQAVQIGNAIEEKRMADALIEARDLGYIRAITDCGAAGLSSAVGEIGEDTGVTIDLKKVPLKYQGLAKWETMLSESQERMVLAVDPSKIDELMKIFQKYNVEAVILGHFGAATDGKKRLIVNYGEERIADLDYDFLKRGLPQRVMKAHYEKLVSEEPEITMPTDWNKVLKKILSHGNVCSKEPIVRQYDHQVQGANALTPFSGVNHDGPNDAAIITPILGKPYGMVVSHGLNPILNRIDPYWGSVWATVEGMANYVAVGGDPEKAMLINNYIWPFPDEESMGSLDRCVDAVVDCMNALERPVISGKDSLSSTYRGKNGEVIKIPPVLCMSVFGRIPDAKKTVSSDIKTTGSKLYLVGKLDAEMGGSTYYDINGIVGNEVPKVDLKVLPTVLRGVHQAIESGEVLACHDVSEGGIIGAISEMAFGGDCGVKLNLDSNLKRPDMFLFNETAGTFVVEVKDEQTAERLFGDIPHIELGETTKDKMIVAKIGDKELFMTATDELKLAWKQPIEAIFG